MSKMTSTMTPSQRRRAYKLKRIVISEYNYLALKRLGQAGDSFNDVIANLLLIQRRYQQEKGEKKQQQKSRYDTVHGTSDVINDLNSSSFIDEAVEKHRQQMDDIFRTIEETQEQKKEQQEQSTND